MFVLPMKGKERERICESAHAWQDPINKRRLMMLFVYLYIKEGRERERSETNKQREGKYTSENVDRKYYINKINK